MNKLICKICGKQTKNFIGLASHISKKHKISQKEYYDLYIKEKEESSCPICGLETTFRNIQSGYDKYCSYSCMNSNKAKEYSKFWESFTKKEHIERNKKIKQTKLKKYGDENYRNDKKQKQTLLNKYGVSNPYQVSSNNYSTISQELFSDIYDALLESLIDSTFYGEKNKEFFIRTEDRNYFYDFVIESLKLAIEFNGDAFHANPNIYLNEDTPHPFNKNLKSKDIWEFDRIKNKVLQDKGFLVYIVWERDYRNNKYKVLQECLEIIDNRYKEVKEWNN